MLGLLPHCVASSRLLSAIAAFAVLLTTIKGQAVLKVSCMHQGHKSCFIEHSRLIILRNDTGSPEGNEFPKVSLYYEYKGDRDIRRVPALSLADDDTGQGTGTVLPMVASKATRLCAGGKTVLEPVAIITRDCSNMWHVLKVQIIPYYMGLRDHGLEDRRMQLLLLEKPDCHPVSLSEKDHFMPLFEALSAGPPLTGKALPEVICTMGIMLPPADSLPFNEHEEQHTDEVALSSRYIEGFVPWIEKKIGAKPARYMDQHQLHITLVNRTGNRRSPNIGDLAEHFRARLPHTKVWVGELNKMSFVEQVYLLQRTSIFVAVHGAAHTLMMFLPPQAVVVEIMPYKYLPGMDFFMGYTNLARICKKSHILWQNTNATWSEGEGKHATTILSPSAIHEIVDASLSRYKANKKAWKRANVDCKA